MNRTSPQLAHLLARLISAVILCIATCASATDIPVLTWTPRSDWINAVTDYGADPTGATDSTTAIQNALTAAAAFNSLKTVYLPAGTYKISSTLTWGTTYGNTLIGCGRSTIIQWSGTSGGNMFLSNGSARTRYIGIAWDGNGTAANGVVHQSYNSYFETRICHYNESFSNFTSGGIYSYGGGSSGYNAAAEVLVWNCLFQNCHNTALTGYGIMNGAVMFNSYQWVIDGCEFSNCDTGVSNPYGKAIILNTHFEGSLTTDIASGAGVDQRVRRCTSNGSKMFLVEWCASACIGQIIQDCQIDGWTNTTGAITLGNRGPSLISDCVFTNAPNTASPIVLNNWGGTSYTAQLMVSNNYCPTITSGSLVSAPNGVVSTIPCGSLGSSLAPLTAPNSAPNLHFLQSTWPADSTNILDVTQAPYSVDKTGATDATTQIQQAITDAQTANNGSVVYLPVGLYKISSTLNVSGGNYTVQGSGYLSQILWYGATSGTMMAVTTPQDVSLEQFALKAQDQTTTGVLATSTGTSSLSVDGLYYYQFSTSNLWASSQNFGSGLKLSNLPTGSSVYIGHLDAPLVVNDCGRAQILAKFVYSSPLTVQGAAYPKTGYLGLLTYENCGTGSNPLGTNWDITVNDNQNLTIGDYYNEGSYHDLNVLRGSGTTSGVVAIQGIKSGISGSPLTPVNVDNYQGRLLYGPQWFSNATQATLTASGTNACDLIFLASTWGISVPTYTSGSGSNWIWLMNFWTTSGLSNGTFMADVTPSGYEQKIATGFDDIRQLGVLDLQWRYGIFNAMGNSTFETDPVNSSPLTSVGTTPAGYSVLSPNPVTTGSGVRAVSAVSGGSPFGPGGQSLAFVDSTQSSTGNRLEMYRTFTPLAASQGAVYSIDVKVNALPSGLNTDLHLRTFTASTTCSDLRITSSGTTATLQGFNSTTLMGGYKTLCSLTPGTWYRIRVVIPPPTTATQPDLAVTVTPWGSSTTSYTMKGQIASSSTGIYRESINLMSPGQSTDINIDNLTLVTGDPLL